MTLPEMLALERDYRRVSAEHRALRVEHWKEAFALVAEPPAPLRKVRIFAPDPILPQPASKAKRYEGLPDLAVNGKRNRLTIGGAKAADRERKRTIRAAQKAAREITICADCQKPTGRHPSCERCEECAYERKKKSEAVRSKLKYARAHGAYTGHAIAAATYDIPAIRAALIAKRGDRPYRSIAPEVGVTAVAISGVEKGIKQPVVRTLTKLCAWLGVAPETFARRGQAA